MPNPESPKPAAFRPAAPSKEKIARLAPREFQMSAEQKAEHAKKCKETAEFYAAQEKAAASAADMKGE